MARIPETSDTSWGRVVVSVACVSGLLLAACGADATTTTTADSATTEGTDADWEAVVEAARNESALLYSTKQPVTTEAYLEAVTERTGLEFEIAPRAATSVTLERLAGEMRAGGTEADVLTLNSPNLWIEEADWFLNLSELGLPNYDDYPESATFQDKCIEFSYALLGITYNTELVEPEMAPQTWADMNDPYWQDQVVLTDPRGSPPYMGWALTMQQGLGTEYLEAIASLNPDLVESASPGAEQVGAGAYLANFPAYPSNSAVLREADAPVDIVVPLDPAFGAGQCAGILANTEQLNAAKVMLNEIMAFEVQAAMCATEESATAVPGPTPDGCITLPENLTTYVEIFEDVTENEEIRASLSEALGLP